MRRAMIGRNFLLPLAFAAACAAPDPMNDPSNMEDDVAIETRMPKECGALATCGLLCRDLSSDPTSCGSCDRTCVIPNATAGCHKGECVIDRCNEGYIDNDRKIENGCELFSTCLAGSACETTCNSVGQIICEGGMEACQPPKESCNGIDDNCDGACDEGMISGCRIPVHRAVGDGGHLYTTDLAAAMTAPYSVETANYFHIYSGRVEGTTAVFLCPKPNGKFFLTSDPNCESVNMPGKQLGYWATEKRCGAQPIYRLLHARLLDHFYTLDMAEAKNAVDNYGYQLEGIPAFVWFSP